MKTNLRTARSRPRDAGIRETERRGHNGGSDIGCGWLRRSAWLAVVAVNTFTQAQVTFSGYIEDLPTP